MQVELLTYLAESETGEPVFKIEMSNTDCFQWLFFDCKIEILYNKNSKMKQAVEELYSLGLDPEREMEIIQEILLSVTTIEGIKQCKYVDNSEPEEQQTEPWFSTMLLDIIKQDKIDSYTPVSERINSFLFKSIIHRITPSLTKKKEIDRNIFEAKIAGIPGLEEEYVRNFSKYASFYEIPAIHSQAIYQFYIMKTSEIVLFFFVEKE